MVRLVRPLFWIFFAGYLALIAWQAMTLPDRIPMHTTFGGDVTRWGGRAEYFALQALLTVLLLAVGPGFGLLMRRMPRGFTNLPHPEYWKSDEHWPEAIAKTAAAMYGFAALLTAFLFVVEGQLGDLALGRPWPDWAFPLALGAFLLCTALWLVWFTREFRVPVAATTGSAAGTTRSR